MKKLSWPILGKISQETFLKKYWQKKPLLMKGSLDSLGELITPDEVAGLSCDERLESRLILEKDGKSPWEVRRGPFKPTLFSKLPKTHWTVLVNGVDRFIPEVHKLVDQFSFIPFWRIDDIMISVAYDQGNVGAHVDNFDVFLVQASGTREWLIEDKPRYQDDFVPDLPIRLLKDFTPTNRWLLEPGDILYLPPRFAHHGIAQGNDCMTISVGFRAPTVHEIAHGVLSEGLASVDESDRYTDPDLSSQRPGEISSESIQRIRSLLLEKVLTEDAIGSWLGTSSTESYCDVEFPEKKRALTTEALEKKLSQASHLVRVEGARMAYIKTRKAGTIRFFANGSESILSGPAAKLAQMIADKISNEISGINAHTTNVAALDLVKELLKGGLVVFE